MDKLFTRPMIPMLISMISGILLCTQLPCQIKLAYIFLFISTICIFFGILQKRTVLLPLLSVFFLIGYILIHPFIFPIFPLNHITHFTDQNKWHIQGTIDTKPVFYGKRLKFSIRSELLKDKNKSFPVTGKIRLVVSGKHPVLRVGDKIKFYSKIRAIRNFNNPGGFDYKRYMSFKGIWGSSYTRGDRIQIIKKENSRGFMGIIEKTRNKISALIEQIKDDEQAALLKALIIGDKNEISPSLREDFNRAGVSHLLAISGLHIGIVAGISFLFFSHILSFFKILLWNAWVKKGAAILSIFPVVLYGLIAGMPPSTQRAVIMISVFLLTFIFEKQHDAFNTLALAAILILIFHPPSIYSVSFQLSFAAVFSIIYGMSSIYKKTDKQIVASKKTIIFIKKKLWPFFFVSFFAIIGTTPLVMYYFNQISLIGIITNLFTVPVTGFLVVPLGLLSFPAYPLSIKLASLCINISGYISGYVLAVVKFMSHMPFAAYKTLTPSGFEICLYYLTFLTVLRIIKNIINKNITAKTNINLKLSIIVLFFIFTAGCCDAAYWLYHRFLHNDLRVTILDVGQGSAALVEMPKGSSILIDGGGFADNSIFDIGAKIIAPFLWRNKIMTIDTIILSHPNSDHLNGLIYIAKHFNVKTVLSNDEGADTLGYKEFIKAINENRIEMTQFSKLKCKQNICNAILEILYPPPDFSEKKLKEKWRDLNNNSIVVKITYGTISFLFPGDIEADAENELVSINGGKLRSTVLVAPHHGSKTSSTLEFLQNVQPELIIISSGFNNRFGFPGTEVINRYKLLGSHIFETSKNGAITLVTDGHSLSVIPFQEIMAHSKINLQN
ncbi:MAG: DNA internalization-related competence protein ComEC/Rec2 [Deltaproteobacteria bacterium]|nr:DNA internalization-related competence protein ComEC/Rec2 [Deltaproteobacteria bacterium]